MLDKSGLQYSCEESLYLCRFTRNELIKLPVFLKCKAMMGICIYCIDDTPLRSG